jgi:4-methylaminobutanoate oxidase (formaldehyde-forming)
VLVGRITSGMFGHTIGKPLGMGYIENRGEVVDAGFVNSGNYEIEVAGERVPALVSLRPFYDLGNRRVKDLGEERDNVLATAS